MNVDEMPAGPEMDRLMARVLGWKRLSDRLWHDTNGHERWIDGIALPRQTPCWSPSTDIAAAWLLVEHVLMRSGGVLQFRAEIAGGGQYQYAKFVDCSVRSTPVIGAVAPAMPLAICRAAYKVVNGKFRVRDPRSGEWKAVEEL